MSLGRSLPPLPFRLSNLLTLLGLCVASAVFAILLDGPRDSRYTAAWLVHARRAQQLTEPWVPRPASAAVSAEAASAASACTVPVSSWVPTRVSRGFFAGQEPLAVYHNVLLGSCCASATTGGGPRDTCEGGRAFDASEAGAVVWTTHLSPPRESALAGLARRWGGCISVAVVVCSREAWEGVVRTWEGDPVLRSWVTVHAVVGDTSNASQVEYPSNPARNVALEALVGGSAAREVWGAAAGHPWVVVSDADMLPSASEPALRALLRAAESPGSRLVYPGREGGGEASTEEEGECETAGKPLPAPEACGAGTGGMVEWARRNTTTAAVLRRGRCPVPAFDLDRTLFALSSFDARGSDAFAAVVGAPLGRTDGSSGGRGSAGEEDQALAAAAAAHMHLGCAFDSTLAHQAQASWSGYIAHFHWPAWFARDAGFAPSHSAVNFEVYFVARALHLPAFDEHFRAPFWDKASFFPPLLLGGGSRHGARAWELVHLPLFFLTQVLHDRTQNVPWPKPPIFHALKSRYESIVDLVAGSIPCEAGCWCVESNQLPLGHRRALYGLRECSDAARAVLGLPLLNTSTCALTLPFIRSWHLTNSSQLTLLPQPRSASSSALACCEACASEPLCRAWSWDALAPPSSSCALAHNHVGLERRWGSDVASTWSGDGVFSRAPDPICAPAFPHVLVFTRVHKTGGSTLNSLIRRLAKRHGFAFQLTTPEGRFDGSPDALRAMIDAALRSPNRTLIALHAPFPGDSPALRDGRVAFFSVVRSPVPRAVSLYYYLRWLVGDLTSKGTLMSVAPHLAPLLQSLLQSVNVTLDECLASLHPATLRDLHVLPAQCFVDTNATLQLRFFAPTVTDPDDALSTAMRVIKGRYRVVGVTELLEDTIDALEGMFPTFFAGAGALFRDVSAEQRHLNAHTDKGRLWSTPSNATLTQLQSLVVSDEALHQFAHERFTAQRAACKWAPAAALAPPPPRPLPNASCAHESFLVDWDVPGVEAELVDVRVSDATACCAACVSDVRCVAWVSRGTECWLKAAAASLGFGGVGSGLVAGYVRAPNYLRLSLHNCASQSREARASYYTCVLHEPVRRAFGRSLVSVKPGAFEGVDVAVICPYFEPDSHVPLRVELRRTEAGVIAHKLASSGRVLSVFVNTENSMPNAERARFKDFADHMLGNVSAALGAMPEDLLPAGAPYAHLPVWLLTAAQPGANGGCAFAPDLLGSVGSAFAAAWAARPHAALLLTNKNVFFPRKLLFEALQKALGPGVDSAGVGLNTMPWPPNVPNTPAGKVQLLSLYRFSICPENSASRGYVTEKLVEAHLAGAVPVYWGSPLGTEVLNPARVIEFDGFNTSSVVATALRLQEDAAFREMWFSQPILLPGAEVWLERWLERTTALLQRAAGSLEEDAAVRLPPL